MSEAGDTQTSIYVIDRHHQLVSVNDFLPGERIEFRCRILRQEKRPPALLLEAGARRSDELIKMCSWCKKVRTPEEQWLEIEAAVNAMEILHGPFLPQISHGVCATCRELKESLHGLPGVRP